MASSVTIDLRQLGRGLNASLRQIQSTVELLDEGNTVPFITRYRKDHTGGLDEEQIREIHDRLTKTRLLADRKQTVLRSIEAQGKLSEELTALILAATTAKRLEDLYLPYKPKKLSLATLARSRGLESLAREIHEAGPLLRRPGCPGRRALSAPITRCRLAADALFGTGHILAEQISELAELRQKLREILQRTGVLISTRLPVESKPAVGETAIEPPSGQPKGQPLRRHSADVPAATARLPSVVLVAAFAGECHLSLCEVAARRLPRRPRQPSEPSAFDLAPAVGARRRSWCSRRCPRRATRGITS